MGNKRIHTLTPIGDDENLSLEDFFPIDQKQQNEQYLTKSARISKLKSLMIESIYPVGSIYTTIDDTFDPNNSFGGTWSIIGAGKCLFGKTSQQTAGQNISAGLPLPTIQDDEHSHEYMYWSHGESIPTWGKISGKDMATPEKIDWTTDPSPSNVSIKEDDIYKSTNETVQPPAIAVIFWKRTS